LIEQDFLLIPLNHILVVDRGRKSISDDEVQDMVQGIQRAGGLLHPIIVEPCDDPKHPWRLVAGERRFRAFAWMAQFEETYRKIPARSTRSLSEIERKKLELIENLKRKDLEWKDEAESILSYYEVSLADDPDYTYAMMSGDIGYSAEHCGKICKVARALRTGDKRVLACDGIRAAAAVLTRDVNRAIEKEIMTFGETEETSKLTAPVPENDEDELSVDLPEIVPIQKYSVKLMDFREFAETSSVTQPFNFIHCDFPYEIGLDKSAQFKTAKFVDYDDSSEIWAHLLEALSLCIKRELISRSAHMLFWFPFSRYDETQIALISMGWKVFEYPLIWVKSDKVGIVPDANRYPRRIYETALLCSLGDRKIIKPTINASVQPSEKHSAHHASLKPRSVLMDWLPMFIDEDSVVLDPTCGSGSALGATLELGARFAQGLDIGEDSIDLSLQSCKAGLVRRG